MLLFIGLWFISKTSYPNGFNGFTKVSMLGLIKYRFINGVKIWD